MYKAIMKYGLLGAFTLGTVITIIFYAIVTSSVPRGCVTDVVLLEETMIEWGVEIAPDFQKKIYEAFPKLQGINASCRECCADLDKVIPLLPEDAQNNEGVIRALEETFPVDTATFVAKYSDMFDFGLTATLLLAIIAAVLAFAGPVVYLAMNPQQGIKSLVAAGVVILLFVIVYFGFANDAIPPVIQAQMTQSGKEIISSGDSLLVDALIKSTIALVFVALGAIGFSTIKDLIR